MQKQNKSKTKQAKPGNFKRVKIPYAVGIAAKVSQPTVSGRGQDTISIKRKEFVGSFTNGGTTSFALTTISSATPGYDLNPGCSIMFPWLSNLAGSFERFRFNRLNVTVIPSQSTATAGRYYAAIDYDYDDSVAISKVQLMGNRTAAEAPVWQEIQLSAIPSELHRDMPAKYVSLNTRTNYIEARTAYCGFLMFATDTPVANCVFDVWVDYHVDLISPVNDTALVQDSYTGAALATTPYLTVGASGTNVGQLPLTLSVPGFVKIVTPGSGGVPTLAIDTGHSASYALDLAGCGGQGKLDIVSVAAATGVTPTTAFGTNKLIQDAVVYNSAGTALGNLRVQAKVSIPMD